MQHLPFLLQRSCTLLIGATTVLLVACLYWSVKDAAFVGVVDRVYFHDFAWLRSVRSLEDAAFGNFYGWSNYFRPLVIALFATEARIFDTAPGPMHAVSLCLHLINTLLVGALARRLLGEGKPDPRDCAKVGLSMLAFGVHPALVEPVVSVSCQFDLVLVLFMLLGLIAHISLRHTSVRAATVATCFFLAACAKESAVVFPVLMVLCDWARLKPSGESNRSAIGQILLRQWPVYLAVFLAGLAYLLLRSHVLGGLIDSSTTATVGFFARFQTTCWLYLTYLRILIWPMAALSPLHEGSATEFTHATPHLAAVIFGAGAIVLATLWLLANRKPLGCLLAAVSAALLPVLRIVPVDFDSSLYHERYAMTAVAMSCALLPLVLRPTRLRFVSARFASATIAGLGAIWLLIAGLNVSVSVPLWTDEVRLWTWVSVQQPDSLLARNFLLNAYLLRDDFAHARPVAESLSRQGSKCPICLLNVANFALKTGDARTARVSLDRAGPLLGRLKQPRLEQSFETASAQLLEQEGKPEAAEDAYRRALAVEPMNPYPRLHLALLLARRGRPDEAQREAERAIALMAPDEREKYVELYRQAAAGAAHGAPNR